MFDIHNDRDLNRLRGACRASRKEMQPHQDIHRKVKRELSGQYYPSNGVDRGRPLNLIELAVSIYGQHLIATAPRVNVTPTDPQLRAPASSLALALNRIFEQDLLETEFETWIYEAMTSPIGVLKVFLDVQESAEIDGIQVWHGPPKAQAVLFEDWVQDMKAKGPNKVSFCGDRWQCSRDWALNSGVLDPDVVKKLPQAERTNNNDNDPAFGNHESDDDYREILELWDIWLPDEGLVVTLYKDFEDLPPLRTVEWSGPACGPYHRLWFNPIPGNSLPNTPAGLWLDLHELVNTLWNKLKDQAERQKTIGMAESSNTQDAETVRTASDGDMVTLNQLGSVQEMKTGGISQENFAFAVHARNAFNYQAGNLDALGGLAAMSGTVGQDELLTQGASQRLQKMQARVYSVMRQVANSMAEHLWENPVLEVPIIKPVSGTSQVVHTKWSRDLMPGDFKDYQIDIEPFSMQRRSPSERLAQLQGIWRGDILPALQIFTASGMLPNPEAYLKEVARLANLPESIQFVTFTEGQTIPPDDKQPPQTTTRQYVRKSTSTKTRSGQDEALVQRMMSGGQMTGGQQ